jgi:hypothetical protein
MKTISDIKNNALKLNLKNLELCLKMLIEISSGCISPEFFKLQNLTNITAWDLYAKGYFNIQDGVLTCLQTA